MSASQSGDQSFRVSYFNHQKFWISITQSVVHARSFCDQRLVSQKLSPTELEYRMLIPNNKKDLLHLDKRSDMLSKQSPSQKKK